jgi:hypothetical protein
LTTAEIEDWLYVRPVGGASVTVIWIVVVVEPLAFDAVTKYEVLADTVVGVPETTPVEVFRLSPLGRAGLTANELTVPVTVGTSGVTA